MSRRGYTVQKVVREFVRMPPWAEREAARLTERGEQVPDYLTDARERAIELACGHIKKDPWEIYGNELSVKLRDVLHHTLSPDEIRRARCYICQQQNKEAKP